MRWALFPSHSSFFLGAALLLAGAKWLGLATLSLCQSILTEQDESSLFLAVFF